MIAEKAADHILGRPLLAAQPVPVFEAPELARRSSVEGASRQRRPSRR